MVWWIFEIAQSHHECSDKVGKFSVCLIRYWARIISWKFWRIVDILCISRSVLAADEDFYCEFNSSSNDFIIMRIPSKIGALPIIISYVNSIFCLIIAEREQVMINTSSRDLRFVSQILSQNIISGEYFFGEGPPEAQVDYPARSTQCLHFNAQHNF